MGSGITESGVKLFGKRVKGTEQFWSVEGAETILALRSKWLSEDEESKHYWLGWPPAPAAASTVTRPVVRVWPEFVARGRLMAAPP